MDFDSNKPLYTSAPHNEHISPTANNVESMSLTGDTHGNSKAVEPPKPKQNVRFKRNLPGYRFEDSIREYCPSKLQSKENLKKTKESYTVNGVNMLNKSDMDSSTALNRIKKKREQHNRVERRRRDMINSAIEEIAEIVPKVEDKEKSARGDVLRLTIDYIRELQSELESLKIENEVLKQNDGSMAQYPRLDPAKRPPTIVIERPHVNNDHHNPWTTQFNSVENSPTYSEVSSNNFGSNCSSPIYGNVPLLSPASHSTNSPLLSPVSHSTNSPTLSPVSPIDNLANPWRRNSAGAQLMPISGIVSFILVIAIDNSSLTIH
ncbi:hypothetical protein K7432_002416 [Basidiobolus ranarum]|uniref:BHLH domain-containing protein n=1 Tax=Basidiobolus ranarum TaxID=34480 RepID=A0ABR2W7T4_9FUNG